MKAWIHEKTGDPDVLQLRDRPKPEPGRGELLVRNRAIGLNPVDWKFILWGHDAWEWPHIPGVDGAGEVEAVGEGVTPIALGARIAYHNDLLRPGSFAEYTVIPARAAIPLPDALPFAAAAAIPCPGLTAQQAVDKVALWPGAHVLVTGASGRRSAKFTFPEGDHASSRLWRSITSSKEAVGSASILQRSKGVPPAVSAASMALITASSTLSTTAW